jgi:putative ATP-binding cassette transporter
LLRTQHERDVEEARIVAALRAVGLQDAVARAGGLGAERDWDDVLSLADQQRVTLARILLAAPRVAVLEGPATLLGTQGAAQLLSVLEGQSITVVTFAADDALAAHHHLRVVLETDGSWSVRPIHMESRTA